MKKKVAHNDAYYHSMAGAFGAGKVSVSGDATGRAVMPMSQGWKRFNPNLEYIWVDDAEGRPRALTPKQYSVLAAILDIIRDGSTPTMTAIGIKLGVTVSTVSRAMTKLAAWGLIRYIVGRGRYAGMLIFRAMPNDGLDRLRAVAKAKLRRWYLASQERISRLRFNVAPREPLTRGEVSLPTITVGATLTAQPFSVQDLRDVGII